ncbi:MAG: 50S ribosomal protein L24 [Candidatus Micrarchaeota archaeon]|nr:50S ribosomal protein L24 [Candidatus Micrarchaeota archaeon]
MQDSVQPRKQRKFRHSAPMHIRKKMVSAHLSKELRAKLGTARRSMILRKGDKVKVARGEKRGHIGKVLEVDLKSMKAYVEGLVKRNAKGIEKLIPIDPSNLLIVDGDFSKDRQEMIQRSKKPESKK